MVWPYLALDTGALSFAGKQGKVSARHFTSPARALLAGAMSGGPPCAVAGGLTAAIQR
jgi:hypothetical protein